MSRKKQMETMKPPLKFRRKAKELATNMIEKEAWKRQLDLLAKLSAVNPQGDH